MFDYKNLIGCADMTSKKTYQKRKDAGLCGSCGKNEPKIGRASCENCLNKTVERSMRLKKKYRDTPGLCNNCGQATSKRLCDTCQLSKNKRHKKLYENRLLSGLCGHCGESTTNNKNRCESCLQKQRDFRKSKKIQVFEAYGGSKCNCCGETVLEFLTIDHINNNGAEHRREITGSSNRSGGGSYMYLWLIKNNFPEGFQVLCANCQLGKAINGGICPHKQ